MALIVVVPLAIAIGPLYNSAAVAVGVLPFVV
jgi:hypothetical protein